MGILFSFSLNWYEELPEYKVKKEKERIGNVVKEGQELYNKLTPENTWGHTKVYTRKLGGLVFLVSEPDEKKIKKWISQYRALSILKSKQKSLLKTKENMPTEIIEANKKAIDTLHTQLI